MCVSLLKVRPDPLATKVLDVMVEWTIVIILPSTRAHTNNVNAERGMTIVFAMKRYLNLETCSQRSGNWMMMRKKPSNCADVTCGLARIWFGMFLKDCQIVCSVVWMHCPPWKDWVPNPTNGQLMNLQWDCGTLEDTSRRKPQRHEWRPQSMCRIPQISI